MALRYVVQTPQTCRDGEMIVVYVRAATRSVTTRTQAAITPPCLPQVEQSACCSMRLATVVAGVVTHLSEQPQQHEDHNNDFIPLRIEHADLLQS